MYADSKAPLEEGHVPAQSLKSKHIPAESAFFPYHPDERMTGDWEQCSRILQEHSDQLVQRWKDEIDMLLVFAGLFSGVLTAFNVQSYQLLQPDPQDEVAMALRIVSSQLNSFTLSPPFANATTQSSDPSNAPVPFAAPAYTVWLNAFWFSALICTLSASSIAIMVRQWLHQYSMGLSGNARETLRLRQYRYDSLLKWHVAEVVTLLPVLLQLALVLFLAGLLILLWSIHPTVATVASVFVGILLAFTVFTTVMPTISASCCYQSPQALCFFVLVQSAGRLLRHLVVALGEAAYDVGAWQTGTMHSFLWSTWGYSRGVVQLLGTWGKFSSWGLREKYEIRPLSADLDFASLRSSYHITLDDDFLHTVLTRCMKDLQPAAALRGCVSYLVEHTTVDELFFDGDADRDSIVDVQYAVGGRQARYQIYLFSQVLALLPQCAESIASVEIDRKEMVHLARMVLTLLPPKVLARGRYVTYTCSEPTFDNSLILRGLSTLVLYDIVPAEAFLKLLVNLRVLDSDYDGEPLRNVEESAIERVVEALPKDNEQVQKIFSWENAFDYFAAVASTMHFLLNYSSAPSPSTDAHVQEQLRSVLLSVEAVLSYEPWKHHRDQRYRVVFNLCSPESDLPFPHPPFLPMLLQLSSNYVTAGLVSDRLVLILWGCKDLLEQNAETSDPEHDRWVRCGSALTEALEVLERARSRMTESEGGERLFDGHTVGASEEGSAPQSMFTRGKEPTLSSHVEMNGDSSPQRRLIEDDFPPVPTPDPSPACVLNTQNTSNGQD